jgi:hypothetical protein
MSDSDADELRRIFNEAHQEEEVVEISADGTVHRVGDAPRSATQKPTVLRDPKGEYRS